MPAAAVIRGEQALYSQTGRKGFYGRRLRVKDESFMSDLKFSFKPFFLNEIGVCVSSSKELKCVDGWPRAMGEGHILYFIDA